MRTLKIFTIMAVLAAGAMAQAKPNDNGNVKTKPLVVKTSMVESSSYKSFVATAYCLKGRMANGKIVSSGSLAVDRRVIPLGSSVFIAGYGNYTATDTGGDIKGNRLDLWFSSCSAARNFGRRTVKVLVLSKPTRKIRA